MDRRNAVRLGAAWAVGLATGGLGMAADARADMWAFIDEHGQLHTAPTQLDARYQQVSTGRDAPTLAPAAPAPAASVPGTLGRKRGESAEEWRQRLHGAPKVQSLQPLLREAARHTGVDPLLLTALIAVESGFNPQATSSQGALGLMQVMPDTADRYATLSEKQRPATERLLEPRTNVLTGARVLADIARRFDRL
ncbi:MAG: transglycosylase SLT domain-containing protein, partial [Pseudomonadota bacterium]